MATATTDRPPADAPGGPGPLLREWRHRRRLSQLDLATTAEVSTRHLSFVETGRARASRELLLHLAEHLDVPLRDRNRLLVAAGFAPAYRELDLDAPELVAARAAIDQLLAAHQPFPATVVDRHWNVVSFNGAAALFLDGVADHLLEPPINAVRVCVHPDGLAPRIVNLDEFGDHLVQRLRRQLDRTGDPTLAALLDEVRSYLPPVDDVPAVPLDVTAPFVLRTALGELSFFSTIATFGAPLEVGLSELAIEAFYPSDPATAEALRTAAPA